MRVTTISLVGLLFLVVTTTACAEGGIPWVYNMGEAQQIAQRDQRLLLVHFYADWCGPCRSLEQSVFPDPNVGRTLAARYVPVKINVDTNQELAKRYNVSSIPMDVITDSQGRVLYQTSSPSDPIQYVQLLNSLVGGNSAGAPMHAVSTQVPQQNDQTALPSQNAWDSPWLRQRQDSGAANSYRPQLPPANQYGDSTSQQNQLGDVTSSNPYLGQTGQQAATAQSAWQPNRTDTVWQDRAGSGAAATSPTASSPSPPTAGGQLNPYTSAPVDNGQIDPASLPGADSRQGTWGQTSLATNNGINTAPQPSRSGWNQQATAAPAPAASGFGNPYVQPGNSPVAPPTSPSLPSGPPVALDGFCPVTLAEEETWKKGNPAWGALHRGQTYLFSGWDQQQLFLADPDRYSPVLSGYDPTRYVDAGEAIPGLRQHGMWFRGKIYLFASEGTLDQFSRNPEHYAQRSHEIMMTAGR